MRPTQQLQAHSPFNHPLRVVTLMLDIIRRLTPIERTIRIHDKEHAQQLRDASNSALFNLAEGQGSTAGTRRQRFESAHASAKETRLNLHAAVARGYIEFDAQLDDDLEHVAAMGRRLMHPRQR